MIRLCIRVSGSCMHSIGARVRPPVGAWTDMHMHMQMMMSRAGSPPASGGGGGGGGRGAAR